MVWRLLPGSIKNCKVSGVGVWQLAVCVLDFIIKIVSRFYFITSSQRLLSSTLDTTDGTADHVVNEAVRHSTTGYSPRLGGIEADTF